MKAIKKMKLGINASKVGGTLVPLLVCLSFAQVAAAAVPPPSPSKVTKFSNIGSILNTRHNMTQSGAYLGQPHGAPGSNLYPVAPQMDASRNDYGEVCVYCHTPHGANQTVTAPLWNRTVKATSYQTYDQLGTTTLTQTVSQPGSASLTCLSCHDGQTAVDSIINMPGSGKGLGSQATAQNAAFLDQWPDGGGGPLKHQGLNSEVSQADGEVIGNGEGSLTPASGYSVFVPSGDPAPVIPGATVTFQFTIAGQDVYSVLIQAVAGVGCLTCHSDVGDGTYAGVVADFRMFLIGTDLRNDHPVGITFPTTNGPGTDWNEPAGVQGTSLFFDENSNGKMEKNEIRTYNGNVECASCHDPHGVAAGGTGTPFNPTFLRKPQDQDNKGSAVCLTCHVK